MLRVQRDSDWDPGGQQASPDATNEADAAAIRRFNVHLTSTCALPFVGYTLNTLIMGIQTRSAVVISAGVGALLVLLLIVATNRFNSKHVVKMKFLSVFCMGHYTFAVFAIAGSMFPAFTCRAHGAGDGPAPADAVSCTTQVFRTITIANALIGPPIFQLPVEHTTIFTCFGVLFTTATRLWVMFRASHSCAVSVTGTATAVGVVLLEGLALAFASPLITIFFQDRALAGVVWEFWTPPKALLKVTAPIATAAIRASAFCVTSKVELNPAIPAGVTASIFFFDMMSGRDSFLSTTQCVAFVTVGVTVGCLLHDRFTGQTSLSQILQRFKASAQKRSWLEQRIEILDAASRQQDAQSAITIVAEKLFQHLCDGGGGAVAVVSLPPIAGEDHDAPSAAAAAASGGVALPSREPVVHVVCSSEVARINLKAALADAACELQREAAADLAPACARGGSGGAGGGPISPFSGGRAQGGSNGLGPAASLVAARIHGSHGNLFRMGSTNSSLRASGPAGAAPTSLSHLWGLRRADNVVAVSDEDPEKHVGSFADWRLGAVDAAGKEAPCMATGCLVGAEAQPLFCLVVQPRIALASRAEVADIATDLRAVLTDIRDREKRLRAEAMRRADEEAAARQRRFLALMSHELRTPLNAVIALSSLAIEEGHLEPDIEQYIRDVTLSGQALQWVITQILEYSAYTGDELGKGELARERFSLHGLMSDLLSIMGSRAMNANVEIVCDVSGIPNNTSDLEGDPNSLRQCLVNLVDNAVRYSEEACGTEVVITVTLLGQNADTSVCKLDRKHTAHTSRAAGGVAQALGAVGVQACGSPQDAAPSGGRRVSVAEYHIGGGGGHGSGTGSGAGSELGSSWGVGGDRAGRREAWVRFEIRDTGPGISSSELSNVFVPFSTVLKKGKKSGTGLGLAITKLLIERAGGTMHVQSKVGKGSTFTIDVPFTSCEFRGTSKRGSIHAAGSEGALPFSSPVHRAREPRKSLSAPNRRGAVPETPVVVALRSGTLQGALLRSLAGQGFAASPVTVPEGLTVPLDAIERDEADAKRPARGSGTGSSVGRSSGGGCAPAGEAAAAFAAAVQGACPSSAGERRAVVIDSDALLSLLAAGAVTRADLGYIFVPVGSFRDREAFRAGLLQLGQHPLTAEEDKLFMTKPLKPWLVSERIVEAAASVSLPREPPRQQPAAFSNSASLGGVDPNAVWIDILKPGASGIAYSGTGVFGGAEPKAHAGDSAGSAPAITESPPEDAPLVRYHDHDHNDAPWPPPVNPEQRFRRGSAPPEDLRPQPPQDRENQPPARGGICRTSSLPVWARSLGPPGTGTPASAAAQLRLISLTAAAAAESLEAGERGQLPSQRDRDHAAGKPPPVVVPVVDAVPSPPGKAPSALRTTSGESFAERLRTTKVLLVEDNVMNQKVVLGILKRFISTAPAVANDGIEGVEAVKAEHYPIILMDMQMPRMGGCDATRAVRLFEASAAAAGRPKARIIALTANASSEDREECLGAGMDAFLSKPVKPDVLRQAIVGQLAAAACEGIVWSPGGGDSNPVAASSPRLPRSKSLRAPHAASQTLATGQSHIWAMPSGAPAGDDLRSERVTTSSSDPPRWTILKGHGA